MARPWPFARAVPFCSCLWPELGEVSWSGIAGRISRLLKTWWLLWGYVVLLWVPLALAKFQLWWKAQILLLYSTTWWVSRLPKSRIIQLATNKLISKFLWTKTQLDVEVRKSLDFKELQFEKHLLTAAKAAGISEPLGSLWIHHDAMEKTKTITKQKPKSTDAGKVCIQPKILLNGMVVFSWLKWSNVA